MVRALFTYCVYAWRYPAAGDTKPVRAMIAKSIFDAERIRRSSRFRPKRRSPVADQLREHRLCMSPDRPNLCRLAEVEARLHLVKFGFELL